ncbi:MAG: ABC transporter permease subunit [Chloroflexi bacterium]|nr:MAG: ABC transporter permease subunit [Chloroflexota bacterium]
MKWVRAVLPFVPCALLFGALAALLWIGLSQPVRWAERRYILGYLSGSGQEVAPAYAPLSRVDVFEQGSNVRYDGHLYVIGSDAGGRDLLVLIAHGAVLSLEVVLLVVVLRLLIGIAAGVAMGLGSRRVQTFTTLISRWIAGFPYLVLAIVLITALSGWSRFWAFAIAMAMVGWRDIAQLTAERVEAILAQPYAEAARALGGSRFGIFRRHVIPHLRPVLLVETSFQFSAVLVLLGELGYLRFFLGQPFSFNQILLPQPELGALLAIARDYIISQQWAPVLAPAGAIALLALAFELLGLALRSTDRSGRPAYVSRRAAWRAPEPATEPSP